MADLFAQPASASAYSKGYPAEFKAAWLMPGDQIRRDGFVLQLDRIVIEHGAKVTIEGRGIPSSQEPVTFMVEPNEIIRVLAHV